MFVTGQTWHEVDAVPDEYLPGWHCEHTDEPLMSLYVPATHALHCCPSGPVYPLLQVQFRMIPLPSPEFGDDVH